MAHLPLLLCDDVFVTTKFVTTKFVTTEFVTTEFATTEFCDHQRTGLLADAGEPARSFLKEQLGDQTAKASLRDVTTNAMICKNYL